MSKTLHLAEQLIARRSVTPEDGQCQSVIEARLKPLGFACESIVSGPADFRVTNLWAKRPGRSARTLVFAGHTDVVPTGPLEQWTSDPFVPSHRDGKLYGRGAADMKTSIAAFTVAVEEFLAAHPEPQLGVAFLLTSDEEGPSVDGTAVVCERLQQRGEQLDFCIVGEPTSVERLGDMIKNGRRGSLTGKLTVKGIQAHIAYPQLGRNPIHLALPALDELAWIVGGQPFLTTPGELVGAVQAAIREVTGLATELSTTGGTGAGNIIPGAVVIDFNFRFASVSTAEQLQQRVQAILDRHRLDYALAWTVGGQPFLTTPGELVGAVQAAIRGVTGLETELSTTGGTSDGRFLSRICPQVIEFGPVNASIHKIDEHVRVADLEPLKDIYRGVLENLDRP